MKYLNGKIYKLIDNTNGNIYIGSTCISLKKRLKGHKDRYYENRKTVVKGPSSRDIIKNNDYKIELLENFPCKTKQELLNKEREYIENNKCININKPITHHQEKLDIAKKRSKEYHEKNRDKILEKQKKYRVNNKDIIAEKSKKYRDKNKDKLLEQKKNYIEANKDKIKERKSEKIQCDICNSTITRGVLSTHKKTLKCKNYKKDNIN